MYVLTKDLNMTVHISFVHSSSKLETQCPWAAEWINYSISITQNTTQQLTINKPIRHAAIWRNIKTIMWSERYQVQRGTYYRTLVIWSCKTDKSKLSWQKAHQWVLGWEVERGPQDTQETFWNDGNILDLEIEVGLHRGIHVLNSIQLYTQNEYILLHVNCTTIK